MKQLRKDLNAAMKEIKALTRKTEQLAKQLTKLEKAPAAGKRNAGAEVTKKKVAQKPAKATAIDTVFAVIRSSRKGADTDTLKKKTGFNNKKVWNNINMLKKKGKIKSVARGVYVKV